MEELSSNEYSDKSHKTFLATHSKFRNQYNLQGNDPEKLIENLLQFFASPQHDSMHVKQSACICLKNAIRGAMETVTPMKLYSWLARIFDITAMYAVDPLIANQLAHIVLTLVTPHSSAQSTVIGEVLKLITPTLKAVFKSNTTIRSRHAFILCIQHVVIALLGFPQFTEDAFEIINCVLISIQNDIKELQIIISTSSSDSATTVANVVHTSLKVIASFIEKSSNRGITQYFPYSTDLSNLLHDALEFSRKALVYATERSLCTRLNYIQKCSLKCLKRVLSQMTYQTYRSPFIPLCTSVYPYLVTTLKESCMDRYDTLETELETDLLEDILVETLSVLAKMLRFGDLHVLFGKDIEGLVLGGVMVLLKTTNADLENYEADPEELVQVSLDLCTKRQSETVQSESANLLVKLCSHLDGALVFVANFALHVIDMYCSKKDPEGYFTKFGHFPLLGKSTPESILEISMLVLSIISQGCSKRAYIMNTFEELIWTNWTILTQASVLVKCRLALLLRFYIRKLFLKRPERLQTALGFLAKGVTNEKKEASFALQAADTIRKIMKYNDVVARSQGLAKSAVVSLAGIIVTTVQLPMVEMIKAVTKECPEIIGNDITQFVKNLARKIKMEFDKGSKGSIFVYGCWGAIENILEAKIYMDICLDSIETALYPLFEYLKYEKRVYFDDNILNAMAALIAARKSLSPGMLSIVPIVLDFCDRQNYIGDPLFKAIYSLIFYGREQLAADKAILSKLWQTSMKTVMDPLSPLELGSAKSFILLQLMFQAFGTAELSEHFPSLLKTVLERSKDTSLPRYTKRELLSVILAALHSDIIQTIQILDQTGLTYDFFNSVFEYQKELTAHVYHTKLLVIGLSTALSAYKNFPSIAQIIGKLFTFVLEVLQRQFYEEHDKNVQSEEKAVPASSADSDSEQPEVVAGDINLSNPVKVKRKRKKSQDYSKDEGDEENTLSDLMDDEEEIQIELNYIKCPVKATDEYKFFRGVISDLNSIDKVLTATLYNLLEDKLKKFASIIHQISRVEVQNQGVIRRFAKAKHLKHS